jgi:amidase
MQKLTTIMLGCALLVLTACAGDDRDFSETSIAELHDQMQRGDVTSAILVDWYINRIAEIDKAGPRLNSIIEINPDARAISASLDREWQTAGPRGPLHGIPVVLKANIDTADQMYTSAGSLALADHSPPQDAFIVKRLRDAGAVILGKANLSEWANFRSTRSSSGWSSVGGQTLNPYDTARSPCGSSSGSGVAVAANLTVVAIGTETDGSVVCPSGIVGIVGIKPTLGLVSRSGIIPIAHSQDTAGSMARSVRDAAILLTAMTGVDARDPATADAESHHDYSANLTADGLSDKRIGVIRSWYGAGSNPHVDDIFEASIEALYEFKADIEAYFESSAAPFDTLAEIIAFNEAHASSVMPVFGQEIFLEAERKGPLTDEAYLTALADSKRIATEGLDGAMDEHDLDALIAITNGPAWMIDHVNGDSFGIGSSSLAAISGYPSITVPAGFVSGLPIGLSFIGKPWNEKQLIEIAYAFEQATAVRQAPEF